MKIGIGICTYNRLDLLQRCINSLIKSSSLHYDLIISSDGSIDQTHEWLKTTSYRWICGPNKGIAVNKNRLLSRLDNNDCIIIIEDDIQFYPQWLEWYIKTYEESGYQHFSRQNKIRRARKNMIPLKTTHVLRSNGTTGQLMFFTKEVIKKCGGFNEKYIGHGYEHLEFTKRINYAFGYGDQFLDSFEGNLHLNIVDEKTSSTSPANINNKLLYKSFKKRYKRMFNRYCFCYYKGE